MDIKLSTLIKKEIKRQEETIDLIPSENIVSQKTLGALGSPLVNKYSEGYPGRRYYPGNRYVDEIETLCQKAALKLFGLSKNPPAGGWTANVQPYSGSPANLAILLALAGPKGKILGFELAAGGHLTMGHKASFTGKLFRVKQYGVDAKTYLLDYDRIERLTKEFKPAVIVSGLTAYPRKIDFKHFGKIAKKVGAYHVADISHVAGLVAAGLHQSPFPYADAVMTTTHKTLRGPRGAIIFSRKKIAPLIDRAVFPGLQGGPHDNTTAAILQALSEAQKPAFTRYQRQVVKNAKVLSEELIKYGFMLLTGGTDNHLMIIDLNPIRNAVALGDRPLPASDGQISNGVKTTGFSGREAQDILEEAGILANRNAILGDQSPFNPSGLRLGTPAVTSRGMKEKEMKQIAQWIHQLLVDRINPSRIKKEVLALCKKFPLPY